MSLIKAIVVDDEEYNRSLITDFINELNPSFEVLGQAGNVKAAYELIRRVQPQVVFLDIRMPDGTGFELLNMFEEILFEVVFISAFDQYAVKAFEFNALDYILKPIEPDKFSNNLKKIQLRIEQRSMVSGSLDSIFRSYDPKSLVLSKIPIHTGNKVVLVDVRDIVYLQADQGCTVFITNGLEKFTSAKQLSDFEFLLESYPYLVKVNKSTYVSLHNITAYSKGFSCTLTLKGGTVIEISRRKKKEILALIAGKTNE